MLGDNMYENMSVVLGYFGSIEKANKKWKVFFITKTGRGDYVSWNYFGYEQFIAQLPHMPCN